MQTVGGHEPKQTALAVCEACGMLWGFGLVAGTVYLIGWQGWSGWTWLGTILIMGLWTCRYCPGHALYARTVTKATEED